jgi:eight-cysteine-cluster-containing protein
VSPFGASTGPRKSEVDRLGFPSRAGLFGAGCLLLGLLSACDPADPDDKVDAGGGGAATGGQTGGAGGDVGGSTGGGIVGGDTGGNVGGNAGGTSGGNEGGTTGGSTGGNTGGNAGGSTGGNEGGSTGGSTGGNEGGSTGGAGGEEPPPCPDADADGLCDAEDAECNADGQPALCDAVSPDCRAGTVPEVANGCYTGRCVTWAECGGAPPPPVDPCTPVEPGEFGDCRALIGWAANGDGTCGMVSGCGCDDRCIGRVFDSEEACLLACVAPPEPAFCGGFAGIPCPAGEICIDDPTDDCDPAAGGADCGGICVPQACPDADFDGRCDGEDAECNADGSLLMCRRAPPICPRGTVPEVREGCYTDACVTWAECGGGVEDACGLPPDPGPCEAAIRRFYHDAATGTCQVFIYGGCAGNANNFETLEACEAACGGAMCVREPSLSPRAPMYDRYEGTGFPNACRTDDDCFRGGCSGEVCSATPDVVTTCEVVPMPDGACGCVAGECQWFVDSCNGGCPDADRDGLCDADDGECNADGNPALCDRVPPPCRVGTVPEVANGCYTGACVTWEACGGGVIDACGLPPDAGPCDAAIRRWFHNPETGACDVFVYGGCGGNANNFESLDACEAACGGVAPPPAMCSPVREGEYGFCLAVIGYGIGADGTCQAISGCGCDDTCIGRVFETPEGCEATCGGGVVDACGLPADPGPCDAAIRRWFHNPQTGACEGFVYGGCGGNGNNFESLEACEAACVLACPDADVDGACDAEDSTCNADGSLLMCRRVAPICPRGTVAEVREGCYTDVCLTWAECARAVAPPVGQACGGFAGFLCPEGLACVDAPNDGCDPRNGGADCPGVCVVP